MVDPRKDTTKQARAGSVAAIIQLLNEKFYSTTKISELQQINKLYKILKFESETWLSKIN